MSDISVVLDFVRWLANNTSRRSFAFRPGKKRSSLFSELVSAADSTPLRTLDPGDTLGNREKRVLSAGGSCLALSRAGIHQ